jgi:hypothetical protein
MHACIHVPQRGRAEACARTAVRRIGRTEDDDSELSEVDGMAILDCVTANGIN